MACGGYFSLHRHRRILAGREAVKPFVLTHIHEIHIGKQLAVLAFQEIIQFIEAFFAAQNVFNFHLVVNRVIEAAIGPCHISHGYLVDTLSVAS